VARAFWKGSVSFGLVEIPVTLRPVLESHDMSFTLLDRKDFSPVGYKRYNKNTGRDVPWDEVVRGYEYEPDEYVVLSDEELRRANVKASETIEIVEFVDAKSVDPVFFDTPYYVAPLKKGSKAYTLLREAMERSGRIGIARVVLRTRQRLAALLIRDEVLVLNLLRYAHEIREPEVAETSGKRNGAVTPAELRMAEQLIEGMRGTWKPDEFRDEYHDDVMALVERKVKSGQTHTIVEPEEGKERAPARKEVVDLMPLLKQSLESRAGGARRPKSAPGPKPSAARTKRTRLPKKQSRSA